MELLLPGQGTFEKVCRPFIARFDHIRPQAIARVRSPQEVSDALAFARTRSLPIAVRCGGHSAAGFSSTHGLLIDVTPLASIDAVSENTVRVGAGALTGPLSLSLANAGLTLPVGTCPSVGIAGLTLGGGFGYLGRKFGFTCDQLQQAEIVLGNGAVVTCDESHEASLFWALRGAGAGNFGVVTSLTFAVQSLPEISVFELAWDSDAAPAVIDAWQRWATEGPGELNAELVLNASAERDTPLSVELHGALLGDELSARAQLWDLQLAAGPAQRVFCRQVSFVEALQRQGATSVTDASTSRPDDPSAQRQGHRSSKSALFTAPWPAGASVGLMEHLQRDRIDGCYRSIELAPWGGAYNSRSASEMAFAHRQTLFSVQHTALLPVDAPATMKQSAMDWVNASWQLVQEYSNGAVYQNFPDPELADWPRRYYGEHVERLGRIKRAYDPDNVFAFAQSLPTPV